MKNILIAFCLCDFSWQTFWTAIGSITAIIAIIIGIVQWRLQVFNNLQRIFTENEFHKARSNVFNELLDEDTSKITNAVINNLKDDFDTVGRKMDQFCHPQPLITESEIIERWSNPIGKAWGLLQGFVRIEQTKVKWDKKGSEKWKEFQKIGQKCYDKLVREKTVKEEEMEEKAEIIETYFKKKRKKPS